MFGNDDLDEFMNDLAFRGEQPATRETKIYTMILQKGNTLVRI